MDRCGILRVRFGQLANPILRTLPAMIFNQSQIYWNVDVYQYTRSEREARRNKDKLVPDHRAVIL